MKWKEVSCEEFFDLMKRMRNNNMNVNPVITTETYPYSCEFKTLGGIVRGQVIGSYSENGSTKNKYYLSERSE